MAVQNNSLKQRKKGALKTKPQQPNSEETDRKISEFEFGTSYFRYFLYIIACLAVISSLSWLVLCHALHKELSFCRTEFLATFLPWKWYSNDSKHISAVESKIRVPINDSLLWVIDRRSNLSLSEFIEKYDGIRFVVCYWCWWTFLYFKSCCICCFLGGKYLQPFGRESIWKYFTWEMEFFQILKLLNLSSLIAVLVLQWLYKYSIMLNINKVGLV